MHIPGQACFVVSRLISWASETSHSWSSIHNNYVHVHVFHLVAWNFYISKCKIKNNLKIGLEKWSWFCLHNVLNSYMYIMASEYLFVPMYQACYFLCTCVLWPFFPCTFVPSIPTVPGTWSIISMYICTLACYFYVPVYLY